MRFDRLARPRVAHFRRTWQAKNAARWLFVPHEFANQNTSKINVFADTAFLPAGKRLNLRLGPFWSR
jgi:hypothetical protein